MSEDEKRKPRPPKKVTPQVLRNKALKYLDRFASSKENLRRVLMRHVQKSAHYHQTDPKEGAEWVDELIQKLDGTLFLNDTAYAEARALSLHRRGNSPKLIHLKLREKGVSEADIAFALERLKEELDQTDLERSAAISLAKRRRLGPWRLPEKRELMKDKDLAALARAGFSYDLAREIIEADDLDALEAELF